MKKRKLGQDFEELLGEMPEIREYVERPFKKSKEEILALADKWGIEYDLDSSSPGIYVRDEVGNEKKVNIEDLIFL